jgi:putative transposase
VTRFRFVADHHSEFSIERMCMLLEVPRSSFYAWKTHVPSARELGDRDLLKLITDIYVRSRRTYGVPRVLGQLKLAGHVVAKSRVARIMHANGLIGATTVKKWRVAPDLFQRNFVATEPNQAWVADITEFATQQGKLFLAAIRDLYHRGIVGWATSSRQDSALVVEALTMAMIRTGHPDGVTHHSDKGPQYTSLHFATVTGNTNVRLSFGSTGDAYDNAAMETVWARLKVEITWIRGSTYFNSFTAAHDYLFEFIEVFYNRQRHQARLGHLTPAEYMQAWQQRQKP